MNITTTPDIYSPSINDNGKYIDIIPTIINGIYCPCGSRKDKIYNNKTNFCIHTKTKTHQKWLETLNNNHINYYTEVLKQKELINNQKIIINNLETQLSSKNLTIDYLTKQLTNKQSVITYDLLSIN